MLNRAKKTYQEFPLKFWVLVIATFIDRVGGTLIFPFFALYVTQRFGVGMTQAGVLFAIFSITGFLGSMVGGALTDKFGRRGMVLFGLVFSALSSLSMGIVDKLSAFYLLAVVVGSLSNIAAPARQAMVAEAMGRPDAEASEVLHDFIAGLGMPRTLQEVGVTPDRFELVAKNTMHDRWLHTNPRKIKGPEDVIELLHLAA